jgi:ribose-phosphate pyrophosphokinase
MGIPHFADSVAERLGLPLVAVDYTTFANSETASQIRERVEGKDVFLIQRIPAPVNEYVMSVALTIDALRNGAGARSVTLVVPYYPYGRQDERRKGVQSSLSNEVVAKLWSPSVAALITVDIHSPKTSEYFPQGFHNVIPYAVLVPELVKRFGGERIVAVSPDAGGMSRSDQGSLPRTLIEAFGDDVSFASCDKKRGGPNEVKQMFLPPESVKDITGRTALLFDDMLDTGGTIESAAALLKQAGALKVVVVTTHPIASRGALERFECLLIEQDGKPIRLIDEIVTTDTLPLPSVKGEFISTISVAPLLARTILEAQRENVESRREGREALVARDTNNPSIMV